MDVLSIPRKEKPNKLEKVEKYQNIMYVFEEKYIIMCVFVEKYIHDKSHHNKHTQKQNNYIGLLPKCAVTYLNCLLQLIFTFVMSALDRIIMLNIKIYTYIYETYITCYFLFYE